MNPIIEKCQHFLKPATFWGTGDKQGAGIHVWIPCHQERNDEIIEMEHNCQILFHVWQLYNLFKIKHFFSKRISTPVFKFLCSFLTTRDFFHQDRRCISFLTVSHQPYSRSRLGNHLCELRACFLSDLHLILNSWLMLGFVQTVRYEKCAQQILARYGPLPFLARSPYTNMEWHLCHAGFFVHYSTCWKDGRPLLFISEHDMQRHSRSQKRKCSVNIQKCDWFHLFDKY